MWYTSKDFHLAQVLVFNMVEKNSNHQKFKEKPTSGKKNLK
jgi:hypothetical protein